MPTPPPPHPRRLGATLRGVVRWCLDCIQESFGPWPPVEQATQQQDWHWKLRNELSALPALNAEVQARLNPAVSPCVDAATSSAVLLILDEMLTNVIKYAHPGETPGRRQIDVQLRLGSGGITVRIEDDGIPFDPTVASRPPDAEDVPLEDRQIGGWGLTLVRRTADAMTHERVGGRNHVTLYKRLPESQVAPA